MGSSRRRMWRWAVGAWLAAVVVAGGLTLWLQDSAEPPARQPQGGSAPGESAAPLLHMDADDLDVNPCPSPGGEGSSTDDGVICVYVTGP
ncbi:hypothetical protein ABZ725_04075 [Streptomyces sp. NPDC006872]|uniref:hypothetical protein n=1 Tax=Streptomyces sp. NPDC006872 TaxID=3155720 RepID=UPI003407D14C